MPLGIRSRLGHSVDMRTILADDNKEIRSALRLLLEELGETDIAEAADLGEALRTLRQARPSPEPGPAVVLLDWELPAGGFRTGGCAAFVAEARRSAPGCRLIAMSGRPESRANALRAGCDAFVCRTDPPDRLLALLAPGGPAEDHQPGS